MVSKAIARYIRISPRKTRIVADAVRGRHVGEALAILSNLNKRACGLIEDVLRSAISNAKKDPDINEGDLFISKLLVDGGPVLKRYRAGSMGRAMMVKHRTSHISIELDLRTKPAKRAGEVKPPKTTKTRRKR
jgi:large subunit ribosomal protein L22